MYCEGKRITLDTSTPAPQIDNVGGGGGFTRSGRLFAPQIQRPTAEAEAAAKAKGKSMVQEEQIVKEALKTSFDQEVDEFMRIIKKSDYKIVDQLH